MVQVLYFKHVFSLVLGTRQDDMPTVANSDTASHNKWPIRYFEFLKD